MILNVSFKGRPLLYHEKVGLGLALHLQCTIKFFPSCLITGFSVKVGAVPAGFAGAGFSFSSAGFGAAGFSWSSDGLSFCSAP